MNAKFAGTCAVTGEKFDAGTEIVNVGAGGWGIARYMTVEGISEWMAAHHAAAVAALTEVGANEVVLAKLERNYGKRVAETLESWASKSTSRQGCTRNWGGYNATVELELSRARRAQRAA